MKVAHLMSATMRCGLVTSFLFACAADAATVVVPIDIESSNPVAEARINDIPVRLTLDSGGGVLTLTSQAIHRVGITPTGNTRATTDALGNNASRNLFHVDTLELGTLELNNLDADETTNYNVDSTVDGAIGRFVLNKYAAVYDYPARRVTFISPDDKSELRRHCRGASINLEPAAEELLVSKAKVDQVEIRMLWDTGAVYSFVKKSFAEEHQLPVEKPYYTSTRFSFASEDFGPVRFVVLDLRAPADADGYVGTNFFLDHIVCIDPTHHVVRIRNGK